MDQQRSALVKYIIKCPRPKSSLINHLINDRLLEA